MMFLVGCPQCGHEMKYGTKDPYLAGKKKKCVYCGKKFDVSKNMIRKV